MFNSFAGSGDLNAEVKSMAFKKADLPPGLVTPYEQEK
jgi:hypothetical protein